MNRPLLAPLLPLLLTLLAAASASVAVDAPAPNSHLLAKLPGPCDVDVQFSRGGRFIVTAGGNEARVWDAQTLRPIAHPLKHDDLVAIRVSDRGNVLLTVGAGARLWDPRTGKPLGEPLAVPRHRDDSAWPADVSSDGSMVAATVAVRGGAARPGWEVEVWSVSPRKRLLALRHQAEPGFVAFSPGAKRLVTAEPFDHRPHGGGETFHLWDVATGKEVCPPIVTKYNYGGAENAPAAFSPDGTRLAIASKTTFRIHDGRTGLLLPDSGPVESEDEPARWGADLASLHFSADGRRILAQNGGWFGVWDAATRTLLTRSHDGSIAAMSAERKRVVSRHYVSEERDKDAVEVWDVTSDRLLTRLGAREIGALAFSPDGRRMAAGSASNAFTSVWAIDEPQKTHAD